ncbi:DUF2721 domain-containing protein [bacterium]|nr:DUF2721 domain-containing protein [bacterium]
MENVEMWLTPLLFLPGVALLVMSTSVRYGQIHGELHGLLDRGNSTDVHAGQLLRRSTFFRNALVSLYLGFGLFSLASLLGGLTVKWAMASTWIVTGLTCVGILTLVFAAFELIRESLLSLRIIEEHCKRV